MATRARARRCRSLVDQPGAGHDQPIPPCPVGPVGGPSGGRPVSALLAFLVFGIVPLALFGLITAAVYLTTTRRPVRAPTGPPIGLSIETTPCVVATDADGSERHEPAASSGEGTLCWMLVCAECARHYQEGAQDVHFSSLREAVEIACARGWTLAGHRMRCHRCA